jgi:metal-dependent hydrolase (beta-lactamase superfamily II)
MVRYLLFVIYKSIIGIIGKLLSYITASKVSTITCGLHCRSISSLQIVQRLEILETELEMAAAVCVCSFEGTHIAFQCNLTQ